jgi:hypothetical protein
MILWIAYEAAKSDADAGDGIHTTIRGEVGGRNMQRVLSNVWIIDTEERPSVWMDKFDDVIKSGDKIVITRLRRGMAGVNITDMTDWAKAHRESFDE